MPEVITDNIDLWTSALLTKSTAGRGSNGRVEAYGIKKVRELILELAVRGKLVPQNPTAEPAAKLLKLIQHKSASLNPLNTDEAPFEPPLGWVWVRLGDIAEIERGGSPRPINAYLTDADDGLNWIKIGDTAKGGKYITSTDEKIRKEGLTKTRMVYPGDFLLTNSMSFGRPYITKIEGCIHDGWLRIHPPDILEKDFLYYLLSSPFVAKFFRTAAAGAVVMNLNADKVRELSIPMPPLAEQQQISAKVDELMALCDQLEQQQTNSIEAHQTLVETLLGTLTNVKSQEEFTEAWTRIANHFDTLFTTEQSVDQLKQTILQLAVMGKLVPQDPNDEPASVLLEKIAGEKKRLIKEGLLKKEKPLPSLTDDEMIFELPYGWTWIKFGVIAEFINGDRGKNYPNRSEYVDDGVPWINTGHIEPSGFLTTEDMNFITREKYDSLNGGKIQLGDLVYCLRGATFGKTAFVEPYEEGAIASSLMIIRPVITELNKYIFMYLISPVGKNQLFRFDNGSAQPNLSAGNVMLYAFPLPPLAEQHRIVAKVNELMTLCDALKARLAATQTTQIHLADTIVEQAVA